MNSCRTKLDPLAPRGASPVWNKHVGHGLPPKDFLPENLDKPLMIGEHGGTYYARPGRLAMFNGETIEKTPPCPRASV